MDEKFEIELRYNQQATDEGSMTALADELNARGHRVTLKRCGKSNFVGDWMRSGIDIQNLAGSMLGVAESGMQKIREVVEPLVGKATSSEASSEEKKASDDAEFSEIGPSQAQAEQASHTAVIGTEPGLLEEAPFSALRIGLLARTSLDQAWQPNVADAMVIPHAAFRPYLASVHWDETHVFEGGYPVSPLKMPRLTHDAAMEKFHLKASDGAIVLVLADGFAVSELHTLMVQMSLLKKPIQIFFHHNGNRVKADSLRSLAQKFGVNARMFGQVECLSDYMAMSDLVVVRGDDEDNLMVLENTGVPMAIVHSGAQTSLINFLSYAQVCVVATQLHSVSSVVGQVLADAAALPRMTQAAQDVARHGSTALCADAVEAALKASERLMPSPESRALHAEGFEVIGGNLELPAAQQPQQAIILPPSVQAIVHHAPVSPVSAVVETLTAPSAPSAENLTAPVTPAPAPVTPAPAPVTPAPAPVTPAPAPVIPVSSPILTPMVNVQSKEALHEAYTQLILSEKSVDQALDAAGSDVRLWEQRLDLARQKGRDDLVQSSIERLNAAKAEENALMQQKEQITQQKQSLRESARALKQTPSSPFSLKQDDDPFGLNDEDKALEEEFRKLQNDEALRELRDKMRKPRI